MVNKSYQPALESLLLNIYHPNASFLISYLDKYYLKLYFHMYQQTFVLYSQDIGAGKGKYYAVNFPLRDGIDDESYEQIFNPVRGRCYFCTVHCI